jgi:hypothetical protein
MRPHWIIEPDLAGDPVAIAQMLGAAESTSGGFENWVQANPSLDVISADPSEVGGRPATRYEIKVDAPTGPSFGCLEGPACVASWIPTAANGWRETTPLMFVGDTQQVVWEVDLPDTNLIIFGRELADAPGFINQVDALVAGLELGAATPPQLAPNDYGALTWPWVASQGQGAPIRFLNLGAEFVIDPGELWFYGQEGWLTFSTEPDGIDTCPQANVVLARARYRSTSTESEPAEAYASADDLAQAILDNDRVGAVEMQTDQLLGRNARTFTINDGEWFPIYTNSDVDDPVLACGPRVAWILEDDRSPWIVLAAPDSQQLALELLSVVELEKQD